MMMALEESKLDNEMIAVVACCIEETCCLLLPFTDHYYNHNLDVLRRLSTFDLSKLADIVAVPKFLKIDLPIFCCARENVGRVKEVFTLDLLYSLPLLCLNKTSPFMWTLIQLVFPASIVSGVCEIIDTLKI